jgi:hypothetical protein
MMDVIESESEIRPGTNSIRVLIVAPSLDIVGGQSRQAVRLMEAFRQDPSLHVGFVAHNPRLPGITRHLQRIKYLRTLLTTLYQWLLLLLNVPRYDIIHIFSASYYSYLLAAAPAILISRLFGKRSILNYRSGEAEDHLANWRLTAIPIIKLVHRIVTPAG